MGTNMGLWKMAEVSSLSYSSLLTTARNFLRAETLLAGNDWISNATTTLSMFDQYDIDDLKHSSSDGQRNRGEAYHRMRRAISYVNAGKFRVKTEAEQQIWNECSRLIANAIIYYNTLLDENAAAHFAFGAGFGNTREEGQRGVNHASLHLDVMVGTPDLEVTATLARGKQKPLIAGGLWQKL